MNAEKKGTKVAADYRLTVKPGEREVVRLRLTDIAPTAFGRTNGYATGPFSSHFEIELRTDAKKLTN